MVSAQGFERLSALKELNLYGNNRLECGSNALSKMLSSHCTICCDTVDDETDTNAAWKHLNVDPKKVNRAIQSMQVAAITGAMGLLEANDPILLIVFICSLGLIAACNVYLWGKHYPGGGVWAGCAGVTVFVGACATILYSFRRTVHRIEGMERCHAKYRATDKLILGGLAGRKLGPLSRRTSRRMSASESTERMVTRRRSSNTTYQHAKAILDSFSQQLIQPMVCEAMPGRVFQVVGLRVMDVDQIREIVDLEHGGDSSTLLDVISCSVIVNNISELCSVCEVLNQIVLERDNVAIHQVKRVKRVPLH